MACACQKRNNTATKTPIPRSVPVTPKPKPVAKTRSVIELTPEPVYVVDKEDPAVKEALDVDLTQCYECAKKHIGRAQILFEEYHTGYSDHIKNLMNSLQVAEGEVNKAFQLWQKVQAHLDMASAEFLGNDTTAETMQREHIQLANDIREIRLKLAQDPLYIPRFDALLTRVQMFEYSF